MSDGVVVEALQRWVEYYPGRPADSMTCTASIFHETREWGREIRG